MKLVNCAVNWVNVVPLSGHGNSGYYSRGNDIQLINCSSDGNSSGGPAFKHFQTDASDGLRYGYRIELKEASVKNHAGNAFHFHRNDIAQTSALYDDYLLQNVASSFWGSSAEAPIVAAADFVEMTWNGEGGALYGSGGNEPGGGGGVAVTGVSVTPSTLSLLAGETGTLSATIAPADAGDQSVSWSSDNTAVATVNSSGVVTALAAGTALITATTSDGGYTDYSQLTVENASGGSGCNFGTPSASALPTMDQYYNYTHVIGSGPSMSNFKKFSIKWNLSGNGLYKFAINTTDGNPDYYNDLRGSTSHDFNSSQPDFTLNGSGLPGLDGEYWIGLHEGNIVWAEKSGSYTIYFSNSSVPPACVSTSGMALNNEGFTTEFQTPVQEGLRLYPNPVKEFFTLRHEELKEGDVIEVYSLSGTPVRKKILVNKGPQQVSLQGLKSGMYLLKIEGSIKQRMKIFKQ